MRFAWQRKKLADTHPMQEGTRYPLIKLAYNAVWWVPPVLAYTKLIGYGVALVAFAVITAVRLGANLYVNNALTLEQFDRFPLRS
jgi:hypothetical protein